MNVKTAGVNTSGALSIAAGLAAAVNPKATAADAAKDAKPTSSLVATDGTKVLEVDKSTKPAAKAKKAKAPATTAPVAPATAVAGTEKAKAKEPAKAKTETKKSTKPAVKEAKEENAKKLKAKKIFDKNTSKSAGEIAGMIAKELEITYSNAYYYVTRVFGKKSKKTA